MRELKAKKSQSLIVKNYLYTYWKEVECENYLIFRKLKSPGHD